MNSASGTTVERSEAESAKKESVPIPIENQGGHFLFSLRAVVLEVMDSQT